MTAPVISEKQAAERTLSDVVIRFAGDSGDGMQLTGTQFTNTSALLGNDLATLPDFPAEIRAPAGTLAGRLGLPGPHRRPRHPHAGRRARRAGGDEPGGAQDQPRRPQARRHRHRQHRRVRRRATSRRPATRPTRSRTAASTGLPLFTGRRSRTLTRRALEDSGLDTKTAGPLQELLRARHVLLALQPADRDHDRSGSRTSSPSKPEIAEANIQVLKAGWNYCDITELFHDALRGRRRRSSRPAPTATSWATPALALGLVAAAARSGLPLFLGAYPITPASRHPARARDATRTSASPPSRPRTRSPRSARRSAPRSAARSASPPRAGPGIALKSEAMDLAVMVELPLIIVDVQRGGPSTGLPTKTEQADLLQVIFGRNSESPLPVIAAASPGRLLRRRARGGAASRSGT